MKKCSTIIYKPWSPHVLAECLDDFKAGKIPVINLDLTAKCSFCSCVYCDSKVGKANPNELLTQETLSLIKELSNNHGLKWIHICGLGEPSEDPKFIDLLDCARSLNIEVSMFTNGMGFSNELIKNLKLYPVSIALKVDSFREETFDILLGRSGAAKRIYKFLNMLLENDFVCAMNGESNLALSMVPTKFNLNEITEIIKFCMKNKIFPAIGEMEESNRALLNLDKLSLSKEQLVKLKSSVSQILGYEYERPLCPGIIPSLHIANNGDCIVDSKTGLSCSWFLMKENSYKIMGNIRRNSLDEIISNMHAYRKEMRSFTEGLLANHKPIFGGGGSQPSKWYKLYLSLLDEHTENINKDCHYESSVGNERVFRNITL